MSKILEASSNASGQVTVLGVVVQGTLVLSEGKQASSGLFILEGDKSYYLPSSATDVKTTIEKIIAVIEKLNETINQVALISTSLGAAIPTLNPPPTLATDVAVLNTKVTELTAVKTELETLKGALK